MSLKYRAGDIIYNPKYNRSAFIHFMDDYHYYMFHLYRTLSGAAQYHLIDDVDKNYTLVTDIFRGCE